MLTKTVIGKKSDAHDSKESPRFASRLKNYYTLGHWTIKKYFHSKKLFNCFQQTRTNILQDVILPITLFQINWFTIYERFPVNLIHQKYMKSSIEGQYWTELQKNPQDKNEISGKSVPFVFPPLCERHCGRSARGDHRATSGADIPPSPIPAYSSPWSTSTSRGWSSWAGPVTQAI